MKNLMKFPLLLGMIAVLFLSACKKDEPAPTPDPEPVDKFEVFKEYLIDNNLDIPDVLNGWITTAEAIYPELDNYYVIDIRSADHFVAGHIPGAVNATLEGILNTAGNSGGKPIIVACYTGQTAGHAVMALRLSGYSDAKVLKWGMCSWNEATASSWQSNIGDVAVGHTNWLTNAAPAGNIEFGDPTLETNAEDGAAILEERVAALLSGGMNKVTNGDVLATPSNYFINNYWSEDDNNKYGHIVDAHRILPLSLAGGEYVYLNQGAELVTYCWTGQTSSMLSAYLKVLGYNAKSLLFGANGMIYENLEDHKWSDAQIMNYDLEVSEDGFQILKDYLIENDMDIPDIIDGWITTAESIYPELDNYYVIDIRAADDYAAGHIPGAVNSTLGDILTAAANSSGKPIIVACYSGQTAGHAVMALRLSGYADAKVLKWGMCSWNPATANSWPANIGNSAIGHSNWTFPASPAGNIEFGNPTILTSADDGASILQERVQILLSGGMNKIQNADVLATPSDYFVNNYWAEEDNTHYGHIADAYRIQPLTLEGEEYKYLNQAAAVVSYCWTGQTSSMLTAYLKVLGYDSKSLLFGTNGMIYENLESHKWSDAQTMDYELESDIAQDGFPILKQYLIDNNMDVTDVINGWITTAENIHADLSSYYIIDIRSADDYNAGHIEGAVNSTLGNVLTTAEGAGGKPIIVACYTGQTAGHAVTALRLSGYVDAKVLKWGMCSWNEATAVAWPTNIGNVGVGHVNWSLPASLVGNMEFNDPSFQTSQIDGAAILAERVEVLLGGFNGVANTEVLDNNGSYFINNFWDLEDVEHYGHIAGARRVKPLTLAGNEYKFLSPSGPVVTYCWTGQTSSMMTAYLKVLGYDSKSLTFGTNGMIYDNLESHKWSDSQIMGYDLATK